MFLTIEGNIININMKIKCLYFKTALIFRDYAYFMNIRRYIYRWIRCTKDSHLKKTINIIC